jgi:lysophospholipase L1-like esterase
MHFFLKSLFNKAKVLAIIFYMLASLPLIGIFLLNSHIRFVNYNLLAHWKGELVGLEGVFCGDSNMAAGRSWSMRMQNHPFNSINLAGSGYTVSQVSGQVDAARKYHPEYIVILAGTNDILSGEFNSNSFENDYSQLLEKTESLGEKIIVIVTLIPYTSSARQEIGIANSIIRKLCEKRDNVKILDLNLYLGLTNRLLNRFSDDGVHLNETALRKWMEAIKENIMTNQ